MIDEIKKQATAAKYNWYHNSEDLSIIRHLTSKELLIITDPLLARGTDYLAEKGSCLLIAASLPNARAYK